MIIINFKNYKIGIYALKLAKQIEKYLPKSIICVSSLDIEMIVDKTKLQVFAQHVDFGEGNRATGFMIPEVLKRVGAKGSLLNHSEHRISFEVIKETLWEAKRFNLKMIVCASNLNEAKKVAKLKPYAIAFEDPKLVGTGMSITKYKSRDVKRFSDLLRGSGIIALCGAGINSADDVREAYRLGCKGVLIASAIANSKRPEILLREIVRIEK